MDSKQILKANCGITIAKNTAVAYNGTLTNIYHVPGQHVTSREEVKRIMKMV